LIRKHILQDITHPVTILPLALHV